MYLHPSTILLIPRGNEQGIPSRVFRGCARTRAPNVGPRLQASSFIFVVSQSVLIAAGATFFFSGWTREVCLAPLFRCHHILLLLLLFFLLLLPLLLPLLCYYYTATATTNTTTTTTTATTINTTTTTTTTTITGGHS